MESMGKKPRRRRSFTPEFKAEIVELCQRGEDPSRRFHRAYTGGLEVGPMAGKRTAAGPVSNPPLHRRGAGGPVPAEDSNRRKSASFFRQDRVDGKRRRIRSDAPLGAALPAALNHLDD